FPEQIVAETDKKLCLQRKFKTSPQKRVDHICDFIYAERQKNYCLKNYENRLKTSVLRRFLSFVAEKDTARKALRLNGFAVLRILYFCFSALFSSHFRTPILTY